MEGQKPDKPEDQITENKTTEDTPPALSKNAMKKMAKKAKWEEQKHIIKAKNKEKKRLKKLEGKAMNHKN